MAGLSDQEIELIAQHIVADLYDRGSTGGPERPAGPSLIGELGIFESMDDAIDLAKHTSSLPPALVKVWIPCAPVITSTGYW